MNAYDFKIIYKKGKININADALSRWPLEEEIEIEPDLNNELPFGTLNFIESNMFEENSEQLVITLEKQVEDSGIK